MANTPIAQSVNQIGEAYYTLGVDLSPFEAGLVWAQGVAGNFTQTISGDFHGFEVSAVRSMESVGHAARRMAEATKRSGSTVSSSLAGINRAIGPQIAAFTGLMTRAMAVVGVFTTFANAGYRLNQVFETGATRAERFKEALNFDDPKSAFRQLDQQILQLESRLSRNWADATLALITQGISPRSSFNPRPREGATRGCWSPPRRC